MVSLAEILERHFQLLAGFHRGQQVRRDRACWRSSRVARRSGSAGRTPCRRRPGAWRRPAGLSPSGNWTRATGCAGVAGTRMLSSTITCPVLVRTAVCSIAHSSGASRLALVHRATQPGGAARWPARLRPAGPASARRCLGWTRRGLGLGGLRRLAEAGRSGNSNGDGDRSLTEIFTDTGSGRIPFGCARVARCAAKSSHSAACLTGPARPDGFVVGFAGRPQRANHSKAGRDRDRSPAS